MVAPEDSALTELALLAYNASPAVDQVPDTLARVIAERLPALGPPERDRLAAHLCYAAQQAVGLGFAVNAGRLDSAQARAELSARCPELPEEALHAVLARALFDTR